MLSLTCAQPLKLADVMLRPTAMSATGPSAFTTTAGSVVQQPVQVRVLDQFDEVLANQPVVFSASGGTPSSQTVSTNAQGIASFQSWTAANQTGAYTITASIPSSGLPDVTFAASVTAAAPSTQSKTASTDNQSGVVGTAVPLAPEIRVLDQYGNGVPAISVIFTVLTGDGKLNGTTASTATVATDATGRAKPTSWILGTSVTTNTLGATTAQLPGQPLTFSATAAAGPPAAMAIQTPGTMNNQAALVSAAVAVAPAVIVRDQYNNLVPGASVAFAPASGSGSVTGSPATSSANGVATLGSWTLGAGIGTQQLVASVVGQSSVTTSFTAKAYPAPLRNFNVDLPPGSWSGFPIELSTVDRGYAIDVNPLTNASPSLTVKVQPEFDGIQKFWTDVLRLGTLPSDAAASVNVLVYDASVLPVAFTGAATLAPDVPSTLTLGPSSANRGYVVEVTPAPNNNLGGGASIDTIQVVPEWNGSSWNDVLRLRTLPGTAAMDVAVRAYETSALTVVTQFTTTLPPGVLQGFIVSAPPQRGALIVEVTPLSQVAAVFQTIRAQLEWNGTTWFDVVRMQTRNTDPAIDVQVRVWRMGDP